MSAAEYIEHYDGEFAKRQRVLETHRKAAADYRRLRQQQAEAAVGQAEPLTANDRAELRACACFLAGQFIDLIGA